MTAMKRFAIQLILIVAASAAAKAGNIPEIDQHKEVIIRTDTITVTDTIVTKKVIKRTEVISRTEEVVLGEPGVLSDSLKSNITRPTYAISKPEMPSSTNLTIPTLPQDLLPQRAGGSYVWIPDSLSDEVDELFLGKGELSGKWGRITRKSALRQEGPGDYDENEKMLFRGDTIPMVLKDRNLGRFSRGLFNYLFIPKGTWSFGVTASYGEFSTQDLEVLDLMSDIDLYGNMFAIRPYMSFFIRNNVSVGLRLGYNSGKGTINSFNVDIDEDMSFKLKDIYYRSESYTAALTFTQYFGITRRGRFGIFNDVELAFSSGNSDFRRPYNGELKNTHTNTTQVGLNFSPGVCVYIMDPVAFNVSFGVFGLYLRNEKQNVDGVELGNRFTSGANFRFNIFNINFGIAVNI